MYKSGGGQLLLNRRAFTLIELLAVIVILAIIALIAVPIILNIIDDAKKESDERSVELYASAIKNGIASYQLKEDAAPTEISQIESYIKYDGARVECTTKEIYADGNIYLDGCTVNGGKETYSYGTPGPKIYANGEVVYFDVAKGVGCTKEEYESSYGTYIIQEYDYDNFVFIKNEVPYHLNSLTGYNGFNNNVPEKNTNDWFVDITEEKLEKQNSCLKFYAFNDDGSETVNLLLDHNTTDYIEWNITGEVTAGPTTLLSQLATDTANWNGTETQINYYLDHSSYKYGYTYTIDYTGYKARIITAEEIAQITENINFDVNSPTSEVFYFDTNTATPSDTCKSGDTSGCQYGWLSDRTYGCKISGCLNVANTLRGSTARGYWTSTAAGWNGGSSSTAWGVQSNGSLIPTEGVGEIDDYGVRPVIEVLKSKLN